MNLLISLVIVCLVGVLIRDRLIIYRLKKEACQSPETTEKPLVIDNEITRRETIRERRGRPPCMNCGAHTDDEAAWLCKAQDKPASPGKARCHGEELWRG